MQKTIGAFSGSRILLGHRKLLSSSKISTYWRAGLSSTTSAILTDDNSTMTTIVDGNRKYWPLGTDPGLEPFIDHFRYRVKRYVDQKKLIEKYEGSLEEFALAMFIFCRSMQGFPSLVARGFRWYVSVALWNKFSYKFQMRRFLGLNGMQVNVKFRKLFTTLLFGTFMEDETRSWLKQSYEKTENHVEKNEKHVEKKELEVGSSNVGTGLSFG
ncbi:1,4-alpha-glucan-branching enzyme [Camellia lanceoleosa]|uniref:1,4-alpha-glucan-branching enzyme n=1 Tax=Camellia lanceoleosa TaxID=1840588 RepID=A0ACC0HTU3_9ERIC|nr:1,4-alpha-glucan-branching enzyme [Camellia lanceoleosa]